MRVTMIEVSASHSRRAGPPPFRKRTSRTATSQQRSTALSFYLNLQAQSQPQPYTKSHSESPLSTSNPVSYFDGQVDAQQQSPIQSTDLSHYTNLFNPTELSTSPTAVRPSFYQDGQFNHQWQSMLLATGQSMGLDQVASQFVDVSSPSTQNPIPLQMSSPELSMSWEDVPVPERNHRNSDVDNASLLEAQLGITSFGSCEYVTSPNHLGSSFSDYMIPSAETSLYGSPRSKNNLIQDLQIPAEYYHATGNNPTSMPSPASAGSPAYRDMFGFESESLAAVAGVASWMEDGANNSWATSNLPTSNTQPTLDHNFLFSWDTQGLVNETTERATFNGEQAAEYYAFAAPDQGPRVHPPMSIPTQDHIVATIWDGNGNGKNEDRRKSSQELISPRSRSGTPWQHSAEHHSHIFSVRSGIEKPKPTRGRMRPLTVKGKREALEVRNAGACWACHLSKVKCSPCSSGSPCEQCSRLHGKRRFCHLPCFNDPIDALNIFLIPDYLMGHFTLENVQAFVDGNAATGGGHKLRVCMDWGCPKLLVVEVVTMVLYDQNLEQGYQQQSIMTGDGPTLEKTSSPPLRVSPETVGEMEKEYSQYVQDVVQTDSEGYAWTAYYDQSSELSERLLTAVSTFYRAGLDAGDESEMLRLALEVHVTCTILERSLILDQESMSMVSYYLGEEYPPRSAARCAQRQMKLAFFLAQRKRIIDVLQRWGNLMWATTGTSTASANNGHKWTTSFSVFLVLILVMDKTLIAAFYYCEGKIKFEGEDAAQERRELRELVRLTQTQLFERCKEVFHSRFKTRKAGKESCNPIRDGWRGRRMEAREEQLIKDLQAVAAEFGWEIRAHRKSHVLDPPVPDLTDEEVVYTDAGRLASIFLSDFLNS